MTQEQASKLRKKFEKDYSEISAITKEDEVFLHSLYKRILLLDSLTAAIESFTENMERVEKLVKISSDERLKDFVVLGKKLEQYFNEGEC